MKRIIAALAFVVFAVVAHSQTTSVTALLQDGQGVTWTNAPCTVTWVGAGNPSTTSGQSFNTAPSCTVDGSGNLAATVTDVAYIAPANTTSWKFCVKPAISAPPRQYCVNVAVTGASQNISSQINAVLVPPSVTGGPLATAYADSEVQATPGNQYFRLSDNTFRCYTTSWGQCSNSAVAGVSSFNTLTGAVTIAAGTNVSFNTVGNTITINATGGGGSGTVTSFSAGNLSPLFTTSVANASTTPALTFTLSNAAQNAVLAGPTSGAGAPTYRALVAGDIPALPYLSNTTVLPANTPGVTHQWISAYNSTTGGFTQSQPAAADISGLGSLATLSAINNSNWSGTALSPANGGTGQAWNASSGIPQLAAGTFSLYNTDCSTAGSSALTWNATTHSLGCNTISGGGGGNTTSTSLTTNTIPKANGANSIINSSLSDNGTTVSTSEAVSAQGGVTTGTSAPSVTSGSGGIWTANEGTGPSAGVPALGVDSIYADATSHCYKASFNNGAFYCLPNSVASTLTLSAAGQIGLATQYSKASCTEAWGGSGTSNALQSGDDAVVNNTCYNDSGVTRTITAVKCRSDSASNTTTVNPTMGSSGTGTTILSGAVTCGSSYAYSSSGTVSSASWATGTGIDPVMGGTLTGKSIAVIIEYTY